MIEYIQGRQGQFAFQHIIARRLSQLLVLEIIENIIFNLESDTYHFTEQCGLVHIIRRSLDRKRTTLSTCRKKGCRLLTDDIEINLFGK